MAEESKPAQKSFYESWMSLALMVAVIVVARVYLLEPFKIPSGSMEPTLIGHEDFGDRILTNKLAYVTRDYALLAFGAMLLLVLQGLSWSVEYRRNPNAALSLPFLATVFLVVLRVVKACRFSFYQPWFDWVGLAVFAALALYTLYWYARNFKDAFHSKRAVLYAGAAIAALCIGMGLAWSRDAIAGQPKRFDVPVFEYNSGWDRPDYEFQANRPSVRKIQDINYIKRLVGLPGDTLTVSGGDLFLLDKATGKDKIIRKWAERGDALQDALWFPVSKAFTPRFEDPKLSDLAEHKIVEQQLRDLNFPWSGADDGSPGAKLDAKSLILDGSAPVTLEYKFPISNIYLKQGRWPFDHINCPAAHLPGVKSESGIVWRNPNSKPERMTAFVSNTWEGVQCPNCKHVYFPLVRDKNSDGTILSSNENSEAGETRFFYGGENLDGDLKLEIKLNVSAFGSAKIEVGNSLRRAIWNIPGGGEPDSDAGTANGGWSHFVQKQTAALTPGEHALVLSYVDGTVIASLDGVEIERRSIDVAPLADNLHRGAKTLARISLTGVKGEIKALNLSRDLYYTHWNGPIGGREREFRRFVASGNYVFNVPENEFLMLGDNSPSSSDGRVWGFVPRERLLGRAGLVWWPPSRWREIK